MLFIHIFIVVCDLADVDEQPSPATMEIDSDKGIGLHDFDN